MQEDKRRSWRRPITGIFNKLRQGRDERRTRRRNFKLELESGGVPGSDSSDGRKTGKGQPSSVSSISSTEERNVGEIPAAFTSQIESTRGSGVNEEDKQAQGRREEEDPKAQNFRGARNARNKRERDDPASEAKAGDEGATTAKRKRRALQALWDRAMGKLRGGKGSSGDGDGKAEVEMQRLRMLKELKEKVEERYGRELWGRAKGVRHELDDGLLLR